MSKGFLGMLVLEEGHWSESTKSNVAKVQLICLDRPARLRLLFGRQCCPDLLSLQVADFNPLLISRRLYFLADPYAIYLPTFQFSVLHLGI